MTSNEIRAAFLNFFASKEHSIVPSASMVVKNDPTLMFTNAGMNQFKEIFLGNSPKISPRIADTQKCLRVSGKHNDLEEVGHDTYHHTMFEMLGNWSFGDYFKKDAIAWAWEFLTKVVELNPEDLYVTIFEGDEKDNQPKDIESYNYWKEIISEDRILEGNKKDNFWEMGDQGPCGPCSEIHVDLRDENQKKEISGRDLVNKDHPLVVEIWNLVFIQFNRLANGSLELLKEKHVDTGMGFERLCMAIQKKKSNYETDIFQTYIQFLAKESNKTYGQDKMADVAMRVCADHIRAVAFAIADGQLPSNAKQGYVIRRILRRAIRYGYTFLGFKDPFMYKIVPLLVEKMGGQFEELKRNESLISKVIKEEEQAFLRTLSNGILKFEKYTESLANKTIDGNFAFELFDTYGFPIDLTCLMAKEKGLEVDMNGFEQNLQQQKERSRNAAHIDTDDWVEIKEGEKTKFLGYDILNAEVEILRYRKIKQKDKTFYQLVFNQTPFYAELGGQIGDSGYIESNGEKINIINTKTENGLAVHLVNSLPQNVNSSFNAYVNVERRHKIEANHSATHLLHYALKEVLGSHIEQKGSMVDDERLRFDFSHFAKLSNEEIQKVEMKVNALIRQNIIADDRREMPIDDARKLGAVALFGEKYGEKVRVMQFGESIELCGGTHVKATGNIGMFKIVSESAIAAGIRRIEAITGGKVEELIYDYSSMVEDVRSILKQANIQQAIQKIVSENESLKESIENFQKEKTDSLFNQLKNRTEVFDGVNYIELNLPVSPNIIKDIAYRFKNHFNDNNFVFIAGSVFDSKPTLIIMLSQDLVKKGKNAGSIVREASKLIQGSGGGQPFFATAGGKDTEAIQEAILKAKELIFA
ncbi:Alanine--tRNA ligase [bioreactor metagenome]|uniref:Alanine--tRNA ligase n=1 Tax=bioreactor metagenome TaxID=1076179 RepID=A0A644U3P0_9ZZZZ